MDLSTSHAIVSPLTLFHFVWPHLVVVWQHLGFGWPCFVVFHGLQLVCCPLVSLRQQPFQNPMSSPCTTKSTHHCREVYPHDSWRILDEHHTGTTSFRHRACCIHNWTPIVTTSHCWLSSRFFGAATQLELSLFSFLLVLPHCNKLGSFDIF